MNEIVGFFEAVLAACQRWVELNTDLRVAAAVVLLGTGLFCMEWIVRQIQNRIHEKEVIDRWIHITELSVPLRLFLFALLIKVARIPLHFPEGMDRGFDAVEGLLIAVAVIAAVLKVISIADRARNEMPEDLRIALPDRAFSWFLHVLRLAVVVGAVMVYAYAQRDIMPEWLMAYAWWRYVLILGVILLIFLASQVIGRFLMHLTSHLGDSGENLRLRLLLASAVWPVRLLLLSVIVYAAKEILQLPEAGMQGADILIGVFATLALFLFVYKLIALMEYELGRLVARNDNLLDQNFVQLMRFLARFIVIVIGAIYIIRAVSGKPLSALLAGLGIGGLAIALAAQDTLKNLFGSIVIMMDKPFSIGQRVVVEGTDGVVEDIGFRSTRVRTLTGHLVTVPNEKMANSKIENIGLRPHIRRLANITITYDTPVHKVRRALEIIRETLDNHEGMHPDFPPRAVFNEFNDASLNILMIYWYHPNDFWAYCRVTEEINLKIMERFEAEGIEFAFPTSTTYLAQDDRRPLHIRVSDGDVSGDIPRDIPGGIPDGAQRGDERNGR